MSAIENIHRRSNLAAGFVAPRSGDVTVAAAGLERMRRLVDALGNPQRAYKTIHVAGSKGKGSTVAYAAAILTATGRKTGRYTSPHLMDWRERIAVDGVDISSEEFDRVIAYVDSTMLLLEAERPGETPHNAFELLTAAAFVHCAEVGCDAAVIEVGIGGRFDSTNVIDSDVAVITSIEAEHLDILGPTLADVAWNKAGIMRPGRPCLTVDQDVEVSKVLRAEATRIGTQLTELVQGDNDELAWAAAEHFTGALLDSHAHVHAGMEAGRLPGRFEVFEGKPPVILDVAHTSGSLSFLGTVVERAFPSRTAIVVLGLLTDKNLPGMATAVSEWAKIIVATTAPSPRAVPSSDIAASFRRDSVAIIDHPLPDDALAAARIRADSNSIIVVTGNFALVAHIRRLLLDQE